MAFVESFRSQECGRNVPTVYWRKVNVDKH